MSRAETIQFCKLQAKAMIKNLYGRSVYHKAFLYAKRRPLKIPTTPFSSRRQKRYHAILKRSSVFQKCIILSCLPVILIFKKVYRIDKCWSTIREPYLLPCTACCFVTGLVINVRHPFAVPACQFTTYILTNLGF